MLHNMLQNQPNNQKLSEPDWQRLNANHIQAIRMPVLVAMLLAVLGVAVCGVLEVMFWDLSGARWFWPIRVVTMLGLLSVVVFVFINKHNADILLHGTSLFISLLSIAFGVMAWDGIDLMLLLPGFMLLLLMSVPLLLTYRDWLPVQLVCLLSPIVALWMGNASADVRSAYAMYLVMGTGMALLLRTIRMRSVAHGYRYQKWLLENSRTDDLTGLRNRSGLHAEAEHLMRMVKESGEPLAMMFIDLDHFKGINDQLGHAHGDRVLQLVGEQLHECVRSEDIVARVGGDEFVVMVRKADEDILLPMAERMRERVLRHDALGALSISVGMAMWDGQESMQSLRHRADLAMLEAKRRGKNRVHLAPDVAEAAS